MILPLHTLICSRYIASRYIASGGMAEIYEANDTYCHKPVAIKVIKEEFKDDLFEMERFENEARYEAMFNHPHIIKIFNVGKYKGNFFIVTELMTGKTLKDKLDQRSRFSSNEAIDCMLQILDATKHIHERGVIHNDLKPENIFLFYDGNIKLLDFGIATHVSEKGMDKANATIDYVAPEVLRSKEYSIKSDIYSLGTILFELITGRVPLMRNGTEETIKAHLYDEIPSISKFCNVNDYKEFDYVISRATDRDLSRRYRDDSEIIEDLTKIKNGEPINKKGFLERIFNI